jgi:hypothetical protein
MADFWTAWVAYTTTSVSQPLWYPWPKQTYRYMRKDMVDMLNEGFDYLDSGLAGNAKAMQSSAAVRVAEQ